jgi:Holliday junction resolvase RusA-like endonuclease
MKTLTFSVPWAALCSDNRKFISGQFILSKEYRESKHVIGQLALAAAKKAKWTRAEGPLALEVVVREPDRRRRDLNWSKNCKDGITAGEGVWWDDSQVRWELWRFDETDSPDKASAGATITITTLDNFRAVPDTGAHDTPQGTPTMGRPRHVRGASAPRLQSTGRIRGRAATPDQPAGEATGRSSQRGTARRAPRQRGAGGPVEGGEGATAAKAGALQSSPKDPRASRHHDMESHR